MARKGTHDSAVEFSVEFDELLRARYPLIAVATFEEPRAITLMQFALASSRIRSMMRSFYTWSRRQGLLKLDLVQVAGEYTSAVTTIDGYEDLGAVLGYIHQAPEGLFVLAEPNGDLEDPTIIRGLREFAWSVNGRDPRAPARSGKPVTIVILAPTIPEQASLEKEMKAIRLRLPGHQELVRFVESKETYYARREPPIEVEVDPETRKRLAQALLGFTMAECDNALTKAVVHNGRLDPSCIRAVLDTKAELIRSVPGCTYEEPEAPDALAGYAQIAEYILDAALVDQEPDAEGFGVEPVKGIFLFGNPGTGKSFTAKWVAAKLQRPLMSVNVGQAIAAGKGLLGGAEGQIERVYEMADLVEPILEFDEFGDQMSGRASSGQTDGGTTSRIIGRTLKFMQENERCMILASANDPTGLDPAQVRIGRFSAIFYYQLPNRLERRLILAKHLERRGRDPKALDYQEVSHEDQTGGFSGAELEEVVKRAIKIAYKDRKLLRLVGDEHWSERDVVEADLLEAAKSINPLSKFFEKRLKDLDAWAKASGAMVANSTEEPEAFSFSDRGELI